MGKACDNSAFTCERCGRGDGLPGIEDVLTDILSVQPLIPYTGNRAHPILKEKNLPGNTRRKDFLFFGTHPAGRLEHLDAAALIRHLRRLQRDFSLRPSTRFRRLGKAAGPRSFSTM